MDVGKKLKLEREKQKLSQEELASAADISRTHYGRIERGEMSPTLDTLIKLSIVMDQDLSTLLKEVD